MSAKIKSSGERIFRFHYKIPGQPTASIDIKAQTAQRARIEFIAKIKGVLAWQIEDRGETKTAGEKS